MISRCIATCLHAQLKKGSSPETSGGLLVCLPAENAEKFCDAVYAQDGWRPFVVGKVQPGTRQAYITEDVELVAV